MSKNKLRIYVDFDGTIANTDICMAEYYNNHFNHLYGYIPACGKKITTWNAKNEMPLMTGKQIGELFDSDFFWDNVTIKEGCVEYLEKINNMKNLEVCILSVGSNINKSKKAKFIERNLPFIDEVMLISGKHFDKNEITSGAIILDDHQKNLQNPKADNCLMYDRGLREFNQNCHKNTKKMHNWKDFYHCCKAWDIYLEGDE